MEPYGVRRARLLKAHIGQSAWRTEYPEEFPVTLRNIDWNGHCPEPEPEVDPLLAGWMVFMAESEHAEPFRQIVRAERACRAMIRETIDAYERFGGWAA
jgi:hypothetical protein